MRNRDFDARSSEWIGDMTVWLRENANDNSELLQRLQQNLRHAFHAPHIHRFSSRPASTETGQHTRKYITNTTP